MSEFQKRIASAIAAGAILVNAALPVLAQTTIVLSGNGSDSDNDANVSVSTTTTVVQSNTANVSNSVDADATTGDNDANDNTGGDVEVNTGDASVGVGISNTANSNVADVEGCCELDADVIIAGNGSDSDNTANLELYNTTALFQDNTAKLDNKVYADADTGGNDAEDNTGGDVLVKTGDASVGVGISNTANSNSARIGGGSGGSSVSLRILGNGSDSDNDINLGLSRTTLVTQDNYANIKNKVDADADTGDNDANDNTGGSVEVNTGDADVEVGIDNTVNFNWADVDCGCLLDVLAKIEGNGSDSDNDINAKLADTRAYFQENDWKCSSYGHDGFLSLFEGYGYGKSKCNDVDADADTGGNDAEDNTGGVEGVDPLVETGNAETDVLIENAGNSNIIGSSDINWPELPDTELTFGVNWAMLLAFWSNLVS